MQVNQVSITDIQNGHYEVERQLKRRGCYKMNQLGVKLCSYKKNDL